jgi:geranylgeranyl diphosphate synthase, type II
LNLDAYMARRQQLVERALERSFAPNVKQPARLGEAVRYSLFGGGKRLRPILVLAAADGVGGDRRAALPFACAVEMIHTYSLIHDDLPAMDDDSLRRGRPTSHIAFGEALAILAGDALLTEAFRLMADAAWTGSARGRAVRAMLEIAEASGPAGMVGGQVADMEAEGSTPDLPTVEYIHVRKTGALILAAIRSGAIVCGATQTELSRLTRYGEFLGVAFQVADDILDAEAPTRLTGKLRGRDRVRRKATFPAVLGLPAAKERARELLAGALAAIEPLPRAAQPLRELACFIVGRACNPSDP